MAMFGLLSSQSTIADDLQESQLLKYRDYTHWLDCLVRLACCSSRCTACSKLTRVAGWTGSPSRRRCTGCWDLPDSRMSCRNPKRLALAMVPASAARVLTL